MNTKTFFSIGLIALASLTRLLPHPANVAPISAIGLFGGAKIGRSGILVPLAALLITDSIIGFYSPGVMISVYLSIALTGLAGYFFLRKSPNSARLVTVTLLASLLFYFITNAAVWWFTPLYPNSLIGLAQSYIMALPFLRNSLVGDLAYTGLMFGAYSLAENYRIKIDIANQIPKTRLKIF